MFDFFCRIASFQVTSFSILTLALTRFRKSALKTLRQFQGWDMHSRLPGTGLPSDYVCISDGVTPSGGLPIHVHLLLLEGRGGQLAPYIVGMQPVTCVAGQDEYEPGTIMESASCLKFSTRPSLVAHARLIEGQFALTSTSKLRWAGRIADGAEDGVAELQAAQLGMASPQQQLFGQLDQWHASETASRHCDQLLVQCGVTWKDDYIIVLRRMRAKFSFGALKALPQAVQKRFGVSCRALLAPHNEATRTLRVEGVLAARNLLFNLRNLLFCQMVALQSHVNEKKLASRVAGRDPGASCGHFTQEARAIREESRALLNPPMLLFVTLRCEHRASNLAAYATASQRFTFTSSEAWRKQLTVLRSMRLFQAAAQGLRGIVQIWYNIMSCFESQGQVQCGIPRSDRLTRGQLRAFLTVFAQQVAGRCYPKGHARVVELCLRRTWQGLPTGYKRGEFHPFAEPVARSNAELRMQYDNHSRENPQQCRKRVRDALMSVLADFRSWSSHEIFFFKARVMFNFSTWPQERWTSLAMVSESGKVKPLTGTDQHLVQEVDDEEDLHFDPAASDPVLAEVRQGVPMNIEQHAEEVAEEDAEVAEEVAEDSTIVSQLRFSLPCDNDPFVSTLLRSVANSKVPWFL